MVSRIECATILPLRPANCAGLRSLLRRAGGMTIFEKEAREDLVLRGGLHDYGAGHADIGIMNLVGVELQVAFKLQIHR